MRSGPMCYELDLLMRFECGHNRSSVWLCRSVGRPARLDTVWYPALYLWDLCLRCCKTAVAAHSCSTSMRYIYIRARCFIRSHYLTSRTSYEDVCAVRYCASTFLTSEHHAKLLKHGGMSLELEWHVALRQCLRAMACGAYMHLQTIAFAKCR